jgi:hypothetical protein
MGRIVLGVVVGFIVWSVIFVGGESLMRAVAPATVAPVDATYVGSPLLLLGYLLRSVFASVAAGFVAAVLARENSKTPLILGVVFLIVGLLVQISAWSVLPVWYHLTFLVLLIPMTMLGGKLKQQEPPA